MVYVVKRTDLFLTPVLGWLPLWPSPCSRPSLVSGRRTSSSPWSWSTRWCCGCVVSSTTWRENSTSCPAFPSTTGTLWVLQSTYNCPLREVVMNCSVNLSRFIICILFLGIFARGSREWHVTSPSCPPDGVCFNRIVQNQGHLHGTLNCFLSKHVYYVLFCNISFVSNFMDCWLQNHAKCFIFIICKEIYVNYAN